MGPARDQLSALADATRAWARDHANLYAVMSRVPPDHAHPASAETVLRTLDLFTRPLIQLGLPEHEVVHALRGFRSAIHGFVLLESAGQFALSEVPAESFGWLVDALLDGVEASARGS